jgi:diketogulonate reductase-like aldo/keto reductase
MEQMQGMKAISIPLLGLGTYKVKSSAVIPQITEAALSCGYRLIDTASGYGNESFIGEALRDICPRLGIEERDILITTKLGASQPVTACTDDLCISTPLYMYMHPCMTA